MQDIKSMSIEELSEFLQINGQKKFRSSQIYDWLHVKKVETFEEMSNLGKELITFLKENCYIQTLKIKEKFTSAIDGTVKYLFEFLDGELGESVFMQYEHGNSVCISTQVGCKMGCTFCASTKAGFVRNLLPSEILEQIYKISKDSGEKISNVVLMGIGEPLDNFDNVVKFLKILSSEKGHNLGLRHVSLSTCGVVDRIYDLANMKLQLTLSVSLHAQNDELRSKTMPINNKYKIKELLNACKYYADHTSRRVSFEYALIKGFNDTRECADELAKRLRGIMCHLNLIPVNEINETDFVQTERQNVENFRDYMVKLGINATIRRTLGADINAACGQLRRESTSKE